MTNIKVYNAIILPHFNYCASILYFLDQNCKQSLQKIQNRCMRIILKCNRYTPIALILDVLQWMSISTRFKYMCMIFIFKLLHNMLPNYLYENITFNNEVHLHDTRSQNDVHINRTNTRKCMNSIFLRGLMNTTICQM